MIDEDFFLMAYNAHIIREEDFNRDEIKKLRQNFQPWINAGLAGRRLVQNPDEEGYHYFITELGEEYYENFLKQSCKNRDSNSKQ